MGDIPLPGTLGIGTSAYTNPRIRCNAEVGGYTGYAELKAASTYDIFVNLPTTRTDGGWMCFKFNNDGYIQLPSSGNKVNVHKDTTISGNLDVGKVLTLKRTSGVSDTNPLTIINESLGGGTGVVYQSTASGQGFNIAYMTAQSSVAWVESNNWGSSNAFIVKSGSNGLTLKPTGDAVISGNLDVGPSQAQTAIKTNFKHRLHDDGGRYRDQGFSLHFETNYQYGELLLAVRNTYFTRCSDYAGNPYVQTFQPLTQSSDDRLTENEELIENACETWSELRPQLYDKKPDIDNDDHTTWYKESGLIAQGTYYDAPELRHLIHKGKPETDEDGNIMPLPEIRTNINRPTTGPWLFKLG